MSIFQLTRVLESRDEELAGDASPAWPMAAKQATAQLGDDPIRRCSCLLAATDDGAQAWETSDRERGPKPRKNASR